MPALRHRERLRDFRHAVLHDVHPQPVRERRRARSQIAATGNPTAQREYARRTNRGDFPPRRVDRQMWKIRGKPSAASVARNLGCSSEEGAFERSKL